jgi:hypothetical protein
MLLVSRTAGSGSVGTPGLHAPCAHGSLNGDSRLVLFGGCILGVFGSGR